MKYRILLEESTTGVKTYTPQVFVFPSLTRIHKDLPMLWCRLIRYDSPKAIRIAQNYDPEQYFTEPTLAMQVIIAHRIQEQEATLLKMDYKTKNKIKKSYIKVK